MAKFKNVSPLGALFVPALGRDVKAGETFEVRADLAPAFDGQPGNFEPVKATKTTKTTKAAKAEEAEKAEEKGDADGDAA